MNILTRKERVDDCNGMRTTERNLLFYIKVHKMRVSTGGASGISTWLESSPSWRDSVSRK